jgi:hypothetical protein
MKIVYTLFLALVLSLNAQAQNATNQAENSAKSSRVKNIVSLKAGITDPILAVVYERLFTPYLGVEAAIGLIGVSIGPKIYLPSLRPNKLNFHTGVIFGAGYFAGGGYSYLPIGINRITKNNFALSFDVGPQYFFSEDNVFGGEKFGAGATFKFGKAF